MKRNFPNWIDGFLEFAANDACPKSYLIWTALSALAGALERNVYCMDGPRISYPNLFVLLVGNPGVGKSQTIRPLRLILDGLQEQSHGFRTLRGIATQAGVMTVMEEHTGEIEGKRYSSLYILGSEASDSALKNHADDFRATACAMYDCEDLYEKRLKDKSYRIERPVMNLIAGSTFDFLKTLVDQNSVMGGLASRFTYVIAEGAPAEKASLGKREKPVDETLCQRLVEDLCYIRSMRGPFKFEQSALALHDEWWTKYRKEYMDTESEKLQSLIVRKPLLLIKTMMLLCVAERSDLGVTVENMERAIELVEDVTKDCARVIASAIMGNKMTQDALNLMILHSLRDAGGTLPEKIVKRKFLQFGGDLSKYEITLKMMAESDMIEKNSLDVKLLIDPNRYF